MPMVIMPNGDEVEIPEDWSDDQIRRAIAKKFPELAKPPLTTGEQATDALIGTGSGIAGAALTLPSLPAEMASGARWLANKAGVSQDAINAGAKLAKATPFAGQALQASQAYRNELENPSNAVTQGVKGFLDYKPETTLGEYGKTTGSFAAGLIGNKKQFAERALKYMIAPGVASETAGQYMEGSPYEGAARFGAGLLGAGGVAAGRNWKAEKNLKDALPSQDDFKRAGNQAFEEAKKAGVVIKGDSVQRFGHGLENSLINEGFNARTAPVAKAVLDKVLGDIDKARGATTKGWGGFMGLKPRSTTAPSKPLRLEDLDKAMSYVAGETKRINPLASPSAPSDLKYLWSIRHHLEDYATSLTGRDVIAGDLNRARTAYAAAKKYWTQKSKLGLLDQLQHNAGITGGAVYTRGGVEHATRGEFTKFLRKPTNKRQKFSGDEVEALEKVAQGTMPRNALRDFGKLGNSSSSALFSGTAAGAAGGYLGGGRAVGALTGFGIPILGKVARHMSNRATDRAVNDARSLVISGKKLNRTYKTKTGKALTIYELMQQLSGNGN